jgi:hypothetical protein
MWLASKTPMKAAHPTGIIAKKLDLEMIVATMSLLAER